MAKDPICGMKVEPKKAEPKGLVSIKTGKKYYFCSKNCKFTFEGKAAGPKDSGMKKESIPITGMTCVSCASTIESSLKNTKGVHDAKHNSELLTTTKTEYEAALAKARAEAQNIFNEGRKKADAKRAEILEEAKTEVKIMIESGKKTLEAQKTKMVDEAREEIVSLAMEATRKVLAKQEDKISGTGIAKEIESI